MDLLIGHFCQSFRLNREIELTELLGKTFQLSSCAPHKTLRKR